VSLDLRRDLGKKNSTVDFAQQIQGAIHTQKYMAIGNYGESTGHFRAQKINLKYISGRA
jgi:hypothetical protein